VSGHARHVAAGRAAGEHGHELHGAAEHAGQGQGHEHLGHAGHADVYRRRFWITLILAVPVVVYSEMIQDWFGFTAPQFPGDGLVAPVLGTVIFFYGGSVFLTGACRSFAGAPRG
jgi:P-type Cu2+ transporter